MLFFQLEVHNGDDHRYFSFSAGPTALSSTGRRVEGLVLPNNAPHAETVKLFVLGGCDVTRLRLLLATATVPFSFLYRVCRIETRIADTLVYIVKSSRRCRAMFQATAKPHQNVLARAKPSPTAWPTHRRHLRLQASKPCGKRRKIASVKKKLYARNGQSNLEHLARFQSVVETL